mmetsp:Transcript_1307/g.3423  ORF Transcript_1307/g.3423 Transcript_1307/m.3423 type:complete len:275 (-) Transcript_1307:373-1197(-)
MRAPSAAMSRSLTTSSASLHDAGRSMSSASARIIGESMRWRLSPSNAKRVLSEIHSSLMSSLRRGSTRITSPPRVSTRMFDPNPSSTSIESVVRSSHGRAVKAYGFEVSAPTGQRSATLPESSESSIFSTYVPISIALPRPTVPSESTPATSVAKRTQRVQWMHRVITVLMSGPRFLSSTPRRTSVVRPRSAPKYMDWSCRSHSPPWSQIGQSSGWLVRRNSMTPSRAFLTMGESVNTFMPGAAGMAQAATGLGAFSISTRHMRQLPATERRSW